MPQVVERNEFLEEDDIEDTPALWQILLIGAAGAVVWFALPVWNFWKERQEKRRR